MKMLRNLSVTVKINRETITSKILPHPIILKILLHCRHSLTKCPITSEAHPIRIIQKTKKVRIIKKSRTMVTGLLEFLQLFRMTYKHFIKLWEENPRLSPNSSLIKWWQIWFLAIVIHPIRTMLPIYYLSRLWKSTVSFWQTRIGLVRSLNKRFVA